jgi:hypothetical protein
MFVAHTDSVALYGRRLRFLLQNRLKINSYLLIEYQSDSSIPKEFFELHAILLPLKPILLFVESRDCTLSEIVPLARQVHVNWRKIFGVL